MSGLAPLGALSVEGQGLFGGKKEEPKKSNGEALKLGFATVAGLTVVGIVLVWRVTRK